MTAGKALLEVAANSVASAVAAEQGGADRIELCAALEVGGLTPSCAQVAVTRERVRIPVYVLIRPRAGDFVYAGHEFETMKRDIENCVGLGCDGVVVGALDEDANVDERGCRELICAAGKLGVTFHRAFDVSRDLNAALETVVALGCERVLTSGGQASAASGVRQIHTLVGQAGGRIRVMPGAGIDSSNVATIRVQTGATEFHASARRVLRSRLHAPGKNLRGMIEGEWRSDVDEVRAMVAALRG